MRSVLDSSLNGTFLSDMYHVFFVIVVVVFINLYQFYQCTCLLICILLVNIDVPFDFKTMNCCPDREKLLMPLIFLAKVQRS